MPVPIEQRRWRLFGWISGAIGAQLFAEMEPFFPTEKQLQEFFAKELSSVEREELIKLPADELTQRLIKSYFEKKEADNPKLQELRKLAATFRGPGFGGRPPGMGGGPPRRGPGDRGRGDGPRGEGQRGGDGPPRDRPFTPPPPPEERRIEKPDF